MIILVAYLVIDGDTFVYNHEKYRLWGVNAPELSTYAGWESKGYLTALMVDTVWQCDVKDIDKYGRKVVQCVDEQGADLACTMVANGYAYDWPLFSGGYYKEC